MQHERLEAPSQWAFAFLSHKLSGNYEFSMGWSSGSHLRSIRLAVSWLALCFGSHKHEKTGFRFFFLLFRKWIPQAGWNVLSLLCSFEDAL